MCVCISYWTFSIDVAVQWVRKVQTWTGGELELELELELEPEAAREKLRREGAGS